MSSRFASDRRASKVPDKTDEIDSLVNSELNAAANEEEREVLGEESEGDHIELTPLQLIESAERDI